MQKHNHPEALEASRTFYTSATTLVSSITTSTLESTMQITALMPALLCASQTIALALPAMHKHRHARPAHGITLVDSSFSQANDAILSFGMREPSSVLNAVEFHSLSSPSVISDIAFRELVFGLK
jgi:hypothetical protein